MKFDEINTVQKKKDLPSYLIGGIDPEDGRICYLKLVDGDHNGECVDWRIPLFETEKEAQAAMQMAAAFEGAVAPFYKVHTQQSIAEAFAEYHATDCNFGGESDFASDPS